MKKSFLYFLIAVVLFGCYAPGGGELVGVYPRDEWIQANPYGMNYIHFGSYTMGPSDQDVPYALNSRHRTVTIPAFYIDQTEISNNEYRQFVYWVKDSLMLDVLAQNDIEGYSMKEREDGREFERFVNKGYVLNWEEPIDYSNDEIFDLVYDNFYLQGQEKFYDRWEIDTRKLKYRFWWIDLQTATRKVSKDEFSNPNQLDQLHSFKGHNDRSKFIIEEEINVYPDTLVWIHDFTYGFNEPLTENYFWHPAYDDYPVVGVSWGQCQAFCAWRSQIMNDFRHSNGMSYIQRFRLPSEDGRKLDQIPVVEVEAAMLVIANAALSIDSEMLMREAYAALTPYKKLTQPVRDAFEPIIDGLLRVQKLREADGRLFPV